MPYLQYPGTTWPISHDLRTTSASTPVAGRRWKNVPLDMLRDHIGLLLTNMPGTSNLLELKVTAYRGLECIMTSIEVMDVLHGEIRKKPFLPTMLEHFFETQVSMEESAGVQIGDPLTICCHMHGAFWEKLPAKPVFS